MHLWKEKDRSEAICHACRKRVGTVFALREVRLEKSGVMVPDVLVAVCEECDGTVAIPAQSTPKLKEARDRRKAETLETRIPSHLDDVIHMLAEHYDTAVAAFRPGLLRFYLREVESDAVLARRVKELAASEAAQGTARLRVSLRAPEELLDAVRRRADEVGIPTLADLIRGVILAAMEDVLDQKAPERRARLAGAAQAEGAPRLARA